MEQTQKRVIASLRSLARILLLAAGVPVGVSGTASAQEEFNVSAYDVVIVGEFADKATENARFRGDSPEEIAELKAAYDADLRTVRRNFSAFLLEEIRKTRAFSEVLTQGEAPSRPALLIDGEITKFDRGKTLIRMLGLGLGRIQFDAIVRIRDASTGTEIAEIEVERGSAIFGGIAGAALTVEYYMQFSAARIASALRNDKCAVVACEEAGPVTVVAPEEADEAAKEFDIAAEQCVVYFYITLKQPWGTRRGVEVWSDDVPVGLLDDEDGFFVWSLEPGDHEIFTRYLSKRARRSVQVECAGGSAVFVHHDVRSGLIEELSVIESAREGERAVRRRELLLPWSVQ